MRFNLAGDFRSKKALEYVALQMKPSERNGLVGSTTEQSVSKPVPFRNKKEKRTRVSIHHGLHVPV